MASKTKSRLGKGLSALMAQPVKVSPDVAPNAPEVVKTAINEDLNAKKGVVTSKKGEKDDSRQSTAASAPASVATPAGKSSAKQPANTTAKTTAQPAGKVDSPSVKSAELTNGIVPGVGSDSAASDDTQAAGQAESDEMVAGGIVWLSPAVICPNPHQPRRSFDEAALKTLAASIKEAGLMQPIIVRPAKADAKNRGQYTHELVAGERRWRAVQLAGLDTIPAIVRDLDENQSAEWALVENLQREDLNPMERAEAFAHLISEFSLSHEQIAQRVGVERSTISNLLRFIDLESQVKDWVRQGRLSAGQARALAGMSDKQQQKALAQRVIAQEMSVRATEAAVKLANQGEPANEQGQPLKQQARAAHLADLEQQISQQLETKVRIRPGRKKGSGTMSIDFYSVDQFDTLLKRLAVDAE